MGCKRRGRFSGALLGLTLATMTPSMALAGDAECVWRAFSDTEKDEVLASYLQGGREEAMKFTPSEATFLRMANTCAGEPSGRALAKATAGVVLERASAYALTTRHKLMQESLDRSWRDLGPEGRRTIRTTLGAPTNESLDALIKAASLAGWRRAEADFDDPLFIDLVNYFTGRAVRENGEAMF